MKNDTITIKKSVLTGILRLLALSAFSASAEGNGIYRELDYMADRSAKGIPLDGGIKQIEAKLQKLFDVNKLVMDSIPADDVSVSECVKTVTRRAKFKKLLKYYGADLTSNFERI